MTPKTILLIDDDDDFLRLLQDRCEAIGLRVERTRNLLSATVSVSKRPPDIICVDVNMPTGNGLAFCEELAADPAKAQIPIVVLTSQTDPETRSTCERLRVHYVEKSTEFWRSLESILRQLAVETASGGKALVSDSIQRNGATTAISSPLHALLATNSSGPKPKKILIADDDQDMLQLLSQRFSSLGYSVVGVDNALDAINMIHRVVPDLVCLDIGMPSGSGLSVCEMMASDEQLRKIPTIVLTGRSDGETIRRCHDLLVYYVQKSADTWERVAPLVGELLGQETPSNVTDVTTQTWQTIQPTAIFASQKREPHDLLDAVFAALGSGDGRNSEAAGPDETGTEEADPKDIPWVLCIDDDADFSDALRIRLENHGVAVVRAFTGMDGYRLAFTSPASAILLDYHMPNGEGDYVLARLKDNPVTKDIPVFVITGTRDRVLQRRMIALGAADFFEKPVDFEKLRARLADYIDILDLRANKQQFTPAASGVP